MDAGVKIYEYTPGFVHSKQVLADDEMAVVGSINFDYRSLVHHYENAVWMYRTPALKRFGRTLTISLKCLRKLQRIPSALHGTKA